MNIIDFLRGKGFLGLARLVLSSSYSLGFVICDLVDVDVMCFCGGIVWRVCVK
jgi:hypothetical protein